MKTIRTILIIILITISIASCLDINCKKTRNEEKENERTTIVIDEKENCNSNEPKKELIANSSTVFNPNKINRSTNIKLAASYIDGLILYPNEEFSFNEIVGKRTAERGFLPADVFVGNKVVQDYGGGICQLSSTICIAVKQTSMIIVEQNPHGQRVSYTTIENEAMINYGTSDFRFINSYDFPVMIEILFNIFEDGESIECNIYKLI